MHIKRYTMASLIFIGLVGWYVFAYITQGTMSIDFFGIHLPSLSTAAWVTVPLVLLYLLTVFHISFYSMLSSFKLRRYEKDYEQLIESIADAYLGKENRQRTYKTERYSFLGLLLDRSSLFPTDSLKSNTPNDKINNIIDLVKDIKNGDVVELKKYSLSQDNAIVIQNDRNKYKKGDINAENILNHSDRYASVLTQEVYIDYIKTAPLNMIQQYKKMLTKTALFEMLARINAKENNLEISNDSLLEMFKALDLDKKDFMEATSILSKGMVPEQRIKLFEIIGDNDEKAMDAYIYTLLDLEMLSLADEILDNSQPNEYLNFKAYRALKDSEQIFSLDIFI